MKSVTKFQAQKRPCNLTLTERNVEQARLYTTNLSATVDDLLAEFVAQKARAQAEKRQLYTAVSEAWNAFESLHGSFSDEHSTL